MEFNCKNCNHSIPIDFNLDIKIFICDKCFHPYDYVKEVLTNQQKILKPKSPFCFSIGQKLNLNNKDYKVYAIQRNRSSSFFYWNEYFLIDSENQKKYLTEYNGHWILEQEISIYQKIIEDVEKNELYFNNKTFHLFEKLNYQTLYYVGFFEYIINKKQIKYRDFICPPYQISIETEGDISTYYIGEHINTEQIRKQSNYVFFPKEIGLGAVQAVKINSRIFTFTMLFLSLLIVLTHWYLNYDKNETIVFNDTIYQSDSIKTLKTDKFDLVGYTSTLTIDLETNLNDSWAGLEVVLLNHDTGQKIYANKSMEYYSGYDSEEGNWSDGSNKYNYNICSIKPGKYSLELTPEFNNESYNESSTYIKCNILWGKTSAWNLYIYLIAIAVLVWMCHYINLKYYQKK